MSRATRDAAAAAEIYFVGDTYDSPEASAFALRNADRVTSLGAFVAPDFASIRMYSQLRDLEVEDPEREHVALLPCSLMKLFIKQIFWSIDWENFRPLCCLQELIIWNLYDESAYPGGSGRVQLDDSFATALPLLRVFHVYPGVLGGRTVALETTAKVVMPHLVELTITHMNIVHLDLHFMTALKKLSLVDCIVSTVSAACSTMVLQSCWMREGTVLVSPNLRFLAICGGGLHVLDGSKCRHALSISCMDGSIEWAGARPNLENFGEVVEPKKLFDIDSWSMMRYHRYYH